VILQVPYPYPYPYPYPQPQPQALLACPDAAGTWTLLDASTLGVMAYGAYPPLPPGTVTLPPGDARCGPPPAPAYQPPAPASAYYAGGAPAPYVALADAAKADRTQTAVLAVGGLALLLFLTGALG
jgi:hypothetical protein